MPLGGMDLFGVSIVPTMSQTRHKRASLPPAKRRLFALVCVLGPLVVLFGIEVLLRLFGYGGYDSIMREVEDTSQGRLVITEQAGTRGFFFANPGRPGYNNQYSFYSPKAANTVRIVLVGGSAIKGFPQTRRFAASSFLIEMLSDCWPDRAVEVINLGTTAVASFPVREFLKQALDYEPDVVVVYSGHNEFYGAYGVASINRAGTSPGMLEFQYRMRGFAIVQGLNLLVQHVRGVKSKPLMEVMVGQDYVEPENWKRKAAANLLYHHVGSMIRMCRERDVPVLVCSLPSNERDLAPIGTDTAQSDVDAIVAAAMRSYDKEPEKVIGELTKLLERRPYHARAHFYLGKAYFAIENYEKGRHHFLRARDVDPMPWRATTESQHGIRRAVDEHGGQLCDVEDVFRKHSPHGAIGWELMDDHVHLSLQGQALLARTIVEALATRTDSLSVSTDQLDSLADWRVYAERLGDNPYDRYGVAHTLRVLFNISFMRESNPETLSRFDQMARDHESRMTPNILGIARQWQKKRPHAGGKRPISGMVARGLLREKRVEEAMSLFAVAQRSVPLYTSWHLEYVYFWLACREKLNGELSEADLELAAEAIDIGTLLLRHGYSESGLTERYIGRMHQLCGEFAEAIPYLAAARAKLYEFDKVAADQALVLSYIQTGDLERARNVAMNGVRHGGQYADLYRQILKSIPATP